MPYASQTDSANVATSCCPTGDNKSVAAADADPLVTLKVPERSRKVVENKGPASAIVYFTNPR